MNQRKLTKIALGILDGFWDDENHAGGSLDLTRKEIDEVRRLMHVPYKELENSLEK